MKKLVITGAALVALAVPAVASAAAPDGSFVFKANESLNDSSKASVIGECPRRSSRTASTSEATASRRTTRRRRPARVPMPSRACSVPRAAD